MLRTCVCFFLLASWPAAADTDFFANDSSKFDVGTGITDGTWRIRNECRETVWVAVTYVDDRGWRSVGWYKIESGDQKRFTVQDINVAWYARSDSFRWTGDGDDRAGSWDAPIDQESRFEYYRDRVPAGVESAPYIAAQMEEIDWSTRITCDE
ncbi:MAG: DUF1036 domain-containing protein [Pseudomonadota bacterium]